MGVVVNVRDQEQTGSYYSRDHAETMEPDLVAADQKPSCRDQHGAGAIQTGIQDRKDTVISHAAGKVVLRFAIRKAARKTTAVNAVSTAMAGHNDRIVAGW